MIEVPDEPSSDELRECVRNLFSNRQTPPPDDIVPQEHRPMDRAELLRLNNQVGWVRITVPGEVLLDADGVPTGVTPSSTELIHRDTVVSPAQLTAAGVTPDEVPNLIVWEPTHYQGD